MQENVDETDCNTVIRFLRPPFLYRNVQTPQLVSSRIHGDLPVNKNLR